MRPRETYSASPLVDGDPAGDHRLHSTRDRRPFSDGNALSDARAVVSHPEIYAHRGQLRLLAWAALKAERGQRVSHLGLRIAAARQRRAGAA